MGLYIYTVDRMISQSIALLLLTVVDYYKPSNNISINFNRTNYLSSKLLDKNVQKYIYLLFSMILHFWLKREETDEKSWAVKLL